jgi:hypothetical protein
MPSTAEVWLGIPGTRTLGFMETERQLGEFLKTRRSGLQPEDVGLATGQSAMAMKSMRSSRTTPGV